MDDDDDAPTGNASLCNGCFLSCINMSALNVPQAYYFLFFLKLHPSEGHGL